MEIDDDMSIDGTDEEIFIPPDLFSNEKYKSLLENIEQPLIKKNRYHQELNQWKQNEIQNIIKKDISKGEFIDEFEVLFNMATDKKVRNLMDIDSQCRLKENIDDLIMCGNKKKHIVNRDDCYLTSKKQLLGEGLYRGQKKLCKDIQNITNPILNKIRESKPNIEKKKIDIDVVHHPILKRKLIDIFTYLMYFGVSDENMKEANRYINPVIDIMLDKQYCSNMDTSCIEEENILNEKIKNKIQSYQSDEMLEYDHYDYDDNTLDSDNIYSYIKKNIEKSIQYSYLDRYSMLHQKLEDFCVIFTTYKKWGYHLHDITKELIEILIPKIYLKKKYITEENKQYETHLNNHLLQFLEEEGLYINKDKFNFPINEYSTIFVNDINQYETDNYIPYTGSSIILNSLLSKYENNKKINTDIELHITFLDEDIKYELLDRYTYQYALKKLNKIMTSKEIKYVIIPITIFDNKRDKHSVHQNMLIIDKNELYAELFEPHGKIAYVDYRDEKESIDKYIKGILSVYSKKYQYISTDLFSPFYSLQYLEYDEFNKIGYYRGGFCAAWSLLWLDYRLKFIIDNQNDIEDRIDRSRLLLQYLIYQISKYKNGFFGVINNYSNKLVQNILYMIINKDNVIITDVSEINVENIKNKYIVLPITKITSSTITCDYINNKNLYKKEFSNGNGRYFYYISKQNKEPGIMIMYMKNQKTCYYITTEGYFEMEYDKVLYYYDLYSILISQHVSQLLEGL